MTPTLLHDILDAQARRAPERVAIRSGDVQWTYDQLRRLSLAYAQWLRRHHVGRGDRVLILAPHALETVATVYAASRLGAIYVVVGDELRPYVLAHILADCEPRLVLVDRDAAGMVKQLGAECVHRFDEIPAATSAAWAGASCLSVDPVSLIYTSGSTAMPKAVVSTHRQVLFAAEAIHAQLRYRRDDVVFCCLPLSFDYGLYQIFLACLAGAQLVLGEGSDGGPPLLRRLSEHAVTVLPLVPSLAAILVLLVSRSGAPPASLRLVTNTGAALPDQVVDRLHTLVPGVAVVAMFGLTECKRVSIMQPEERLGRPGSVGRPLPDTEVFVVDDDGRRLPAGEVGELVVRGPHVMAGYWRAPELTAAKFRRDQLGDTLLFTGDYGRLDADGYLYFVGRRDELYKQGGFRISAVEVEAAAMDIRGVELAAVLPPTDDRGAVLVVSGQLTETAVVTELAQRLEQARLPSECHVMHALPLRPNGKVDKRALAASLPRPMARSVAR